MKRLIVLAACVLALSGVHIAIADTLELADGTLIEGQLVGMSNGIIMWNTGAGIEAFPEDDVVAIFNSEGVAAREARTSQPAPREVTVPAGTRLMIRTMDSLDSRRHSVGHRFRGQLEGALVVGNTTVAPRGATVHGRIAQARQGGRVAGSSELTVEFTDLAINDRLVPIVTTDLKAQTGNEAGRTVGRTARTAAIGGLVGGRSGAKTGAKVGLGASILTGGQSINIPSGTLVEARLASPLTLQQ